MPLERRTIHDSSEEHGVIPRVHGFPLLTHHVRHHSKQEWDTPRRSPIRNIVKPCRRRSRELTREFLLIIGQHVDREPRRAVHRMVKRVIVIDTDQYEGRVERDRCHGGGRHSLWRSV